MNGTRHHTLSSIADTQEFAISLTKFICQGEALLLSGEIGTGKSVIARAFIRELLGPNSQECEFPSPTYTLVQSYHGHETEILHADLYRLNSPLEVVELGLLDAFESSICIVEWAEKLEEFTPKRFVKLTMHYSTLGESFRIAVIEASNEELTTRLERFLPPT